MPKTSRQWAREISETLNACSVTASSRLSLYHTTAPAAARELHEHVSSEPFKCGNRGSKAVPKTNRTIALADVVLARAAVTQSFESIANDGKRWNVEVVNDINISSEAFE